MRDEGEIIHTKKFYHDDHTVLHQQVLLPVGTAWFLSMTGKIKNSMALSNQSCGENMPPKNHLPSLVFSAIYFIKRFSYLISTSKTFIDVFMTTTVIGAVDTLIAVSRCRGALWP